MRVGRFIDRGHDALTTWVGSAIFLAAIAGFALWSSSAGLLLFSTIMGIGHIMLMASQQMLCVRAAGPRSMESAFGNFMVANAIGQGLGPYVVGCVGGVVAVPPTQLLFTIGAVLAGAVACRLADDAAGSATGRAEVARQGRSCRSGSCCACRGSLAVIMAGVILVSASDSVVVYIPLLGAERHIDVHDIGLLLTVRAAASMLARLFYARLVAQASAAGR